MNLWGVRSARVRSEISPDLVRLFDRVLQIRNCSLICGRRGKDEQDEEVAKGTSEVNWPNSYHNCEEDELADAVDAIPYPTTQADWEDREFWVEWTSFVKGVAAGLGIEIISGYDWDNDYDLDDQKFYDGPHFQLMVKKV